MLKCLNQQKQKEFLKRKIDWKILLDHLRKRMEEEDPENTEVRHSSWMYILDPQHKMVRRGEDHKLIRQKE